MKLIKIDLRTIKENPNAGNTIHEIQGTPTAELKLNGVTEREFKALEKMIIVTKRTIAQPYGIQTVEGRVKTKYITKIIPVIERLGNGLQDRFEMTVHNNNQVINSMTPEPKYFYKHLNTKVKCGYCGAKFPHTELQTDWVVGPDGDDIPHDNVCPKCGEIECCEIKYETIDEALKRKK